MTDAEPGHTFHHARYGRGREGKHEVEINPVRDGDSGDDRASWPHECWPGTDASHERDQNQLDHGPTQPWTGRDAGRGARLCLLDRKLHLDHVLRRRWESVEPRRGAPRKR